MLSFLSVFVIAACQQTISLPLQGGTQAGLTFDDAGVVLSSTAILDGGIAQGTFTSKVVDLGSATTPRRFWFAPVTPSGLALPTANQTDPLSFRSGRVDMQHTLVLFPFEEGAGVTVPNEVSKYRATTSIVGQVRLGAAGLIGSSADFAGGCVRVVDSPSPQPVQHLTASAWIRPRNQFGQAAGILSRRLNYGDKTQFSLFLWDNNFLYVDVEGEMDRFRGNRSIPHDQWSHVAFVYNGAEPANRRVRLYVNGVLDVVGFESSDKLTAQPTVPVSVGCLPLGGLTEQSFQGQIDEVALLATSLTDSEVYSLYARGVSNHALEARVCTEPTCRGVPFAAVKSGGASPSQMGRYAQVRISSRAPAISPDWSRIESVTLDVECAGIDAGPPSATVDAGAKQVRGSGDWGDITPTRNEGWQGTFASVEPEPPPGSDDPLLDAGSYWVGAGCSHTTLGPWVTLLVLMARRRRARFNLAEVSGRATRRAACVFSSQVSFWSR